LRWLPYIALGGFSQRGPREFFARLLHSRLQTKAGYGAVLSRIELRASRAVAPR